MIRSKGHDHLLRTALRACRGDRRCRPRSRSARRRSGSEPGPCRRPMRSSSATGRHPIRTCDLAPRTRRASLSSALLSWSSRSEDQVSKCTLKRSRVSSMRLRIRSTPSVSSSPTSLGIRAGRAAAPRRAPSRTRRSTHRRAARHPPSAPRSTLQTSGSASRRRSSSTRARLHAPPSRGRGQANRRNAAPRPPAAVSGPVGLAETNSRSTAGVAGGDFAETLRIKHRRDARADATNPRGRGSRSRGPRPPAGRRPAPSLDSRSLGQALGDIAAASRPARCEEHRGVGRVVPLLRPLGPLHGRFLAGLRPGRGNGRTHGRAQV